MKNRFIYILAVVLTVLSFDGLGQAQAIIAKTVVLSPEDQQALLQVEQYLNELTTLKARFRQRASNGEEEQGTLYLARPKRMRVEYDLPNPNLLISDGTYLTFVDRELDNATTIYLSMTPAELILRDKMSFQAGDIIVNGFERGRGVVRVSLIKAADPLAGRLTLVFSQRPLALKQWNVLDAQGIETEISLSNVRMGQIFDKALFNYEVKDQDADLK